LRSSRKFCVDLECSNTGIDSRQGAKHAKFRNRKIDNFYKPSYSFFPTFAALASLREISRVSVAALPRWVSVVNNLKLPFLAHHRIVDGNRDIIRDAFKPQDAVETIAHVICPLIENRQSKI
jgi:hypothetical protein